jgi:AcrR family transcriptional regulator
MFRHFRSKNELLGAVLDYYSQFDQDIMQSTKLKQLNPCDAIIFLVSSYAEYYQNYPAITSIMQLMDVLRYEPDLKDKVNSILETRTCYLNQLIEAAQISGDFNPEINNEGISDMISGVVYEICLNWRVNNHSFSLKQRILSTLNMYLSVIRIKNQKS